LNQTKKTLKIQSFNNTGRQLGAKKYKQDNESTYTIIDRHNFTTILYTLRPKPTPKWLLAPPHKTDLLLAEKISQNFDPADVIKSKTLALMDKYKHSMEIVTDDKLTKTGKTASAFYIPELKYGHVQRLDDTTSVFSAEMAAIKMALEWLIHTGDNSNTPATIYSDSLSTVSAIKSQDSKTTPSKNTHHQRNPGPHTQHQQSNNIRLDSKSRRYTRKRSRG